MVQKAKGRKPNSNSPRRRRNPEPTPAYIGTDSEWDTHLPEPWLGTTFYNDSLQVQYKPDHIPAEAKSELRSEAAALGFTLVFIKRRDDTYLLGDFLDRAGVTHKHINLIIYFSMKDLEYALGWPPLHRALQDKTLTQNSNCLGKVAVPGRTVIVKDLIGWAAKGGLDKFTEGQGIANPSKHLIRPEEKKRMWGVLLARPRDFLRYESADGSILPAVYFRFLQNIRSIQKDYLRMPEETLWTATTIPTTIGSLDARTFERLLYARSEVDPRIYRLALMKVGMLDPDRHDHDHQRAVFHRTYGRYRSVESMGEGFASGDRDLEEMMKIVPKHSALDGCSVKWFAERANTDTAIYNALVQGGRCNNENPEVILLGQGNDMDLSGCYGETLRSLEYPVGLPYYWSQTSQQEATRSLGDWLAMVGHDLVEGLWTATVTGDLGFNQDLLFSKLVKPSDIAKAIRSQHTQLEEDTDIPADFGLFRSRVVNGIITSDILQALRAIATNTEWKSLMRLKVVTAVAYRKSDRVESQAAWCDRILRTTGEYHTEALSEIKDERSRAWFSFPMEEFVGRIVERRKEFKKAMKDESLSTEDRAMATGLSETLKLMTNVVYGIMASRHFRVSNTVVANVITAKARLGVWMTAKSLNLRQTITDGGIYMPTQVHFFTGKKRPGLATLSDAHRWNRPSLMRRTRPLPGFDWDRPLEEWPDQSECDRLATLHNDDFWRPYGLTMRFRLEHKQAFRRAAYLGKADYALVHWDKDQADWDTVYKCRGKHEDDPIPHPIYALLTSILDGRDDFPASMGWTSERILKVKSWRRIQSSLKGYQDLKHLRPGDSYHTDHVATFNNTHFPLRDEADLLRRRGRARLQKGEKVLLFERFGDRGIAFLLDQMTHDHFRDTQGKPLSN